MLTGGQPLGEKFMVIVVEAKPEEELRNSEGL